MKHQRVVYKNPKWQNVKHKSSERQNIYFSLWLGIENAKFVVQLPVSFIGDPFDVLAQILDISVAAAVKGEKVSYHCMNWFFEWVALEF